jgi:hydrogenase/urease accessory protein HupE
MFRMTVFQAHLVTSGAGPFFDGIAHFFVSPEDLLVVVVLSLGSGLLGKPTARWLVVALPIAWMAGLAAGMTVARPAEGSSWASATTMLAAGLLLGLHPKLPTWAMASLAALIGLLHGIWNGAAMVATNTSAIASLGIVAAAAVVAVLLSALAVSTSKPWQIIALRVIGSWVAAFGLLALAWHLRSIG